VSAADLSATDRGGYKKRVESLSTADRHAGIEPAVANANKINIAEARRAHA